MKEKIRRGRRQERPPNLPRCPFCGRRVSVRKVEDRLHHCAHCQKMFQV